MLNKWDRHFLSLASRIQVCQKIMFSYSIYYASVWMFSNYQLNDIQKTIRKFLWLDGRGGKKKHAVKWEWCCMEKKDGGLGLKDLKLQGIALAAKWIFHSLSGERPWKVLVRNNIKRVVPKQGKTWKDLPFSDLVAGDFPVSTSGSLVFKTIWKAWENVRNWISSTLR